MGGRLGTHRRKRSVDLESWDWGGRGVGGRERGRKDRSFAGRVRREGRVEDRDTDRSRILVIQGYERQMTNEEIIEYIKQKMGVDIAIDKGLWRRAKGGGNRLIAILELRSPDQVWEVLRRRANLKGERIYVHPDRPFEEREQRRIWRERMMRGGAGTMGQGGFLPGGGPMGGGWVYIPSGRSAPQNPQAPWKGQHQGMDRGNGERYWRW